MVLQIGVNFLFSEMCLDQALTMHAILRQKQCPYQLLNAVSGMIYSRQLFVILFHKIKISVLKEYHWFKLKCLISKRICTNFKTKQQLHIIIINFVISFLSIKMDVQQFVTVSLR